VTTIDYRRRIEGGKPVRTSWEGYAMSRDSTVIPFRRPEAIDDPLSERAREGKRRMPAQCADRRSDPFVQMPRWSAKFLNGAGQQQIGSGARGLRIAYRLRRKRKYAQSSLVLGTQMSCERTIYYPFLPCSAAQAGGRLAAALNSSATATARSTAL